MTRGTYIAATGMLANQVALDAISQNLANASTVGYKQDNARTESFQDALLRRMTGGSAQDVGALGSGAQVKSLTTDFADGVMQKTGNGLDVALTGDAYLAIQTPQGVCYSRDGSLTRNAQGLLVQSNGGGLVLGQNGRPFSLPSKAKDIAIDIRGEITADGASVGRLRLVGLGPNDGTIKIGDNHFLAATVRTASAGATVRQGFLEMSNVNVVKEMVAMITVMRAYETNAKMMQAEDSVTGKAVNDISKV